MTAVAPPPNDLPKNPFEALPCSLPVVDFQDDAASLESALKSCHENLDLQNLLQDDFAPDAIWRDTFALTGTLRTFYSSTSVSKAWATTLASREAAFFTLLPDSPAAGVVRLSKDNAWVDVPFTFETAAEPKTSCSGVVSLVPAPGGKWTIWMLRTVLEQLHNCPDPDHLRPDSAIESNGTHVNSDVELGSNDQQLFDCVVVGGGQGGLSVAGRLKAVGLSYVVIDKHPHVGDSWNSRYDSVKQNTVGPLKLGSELSKAKHFETLAHLPFERTFPASSYPEYLTKADLAGGFQGYVKKFGINIWQSTELKSGSWNEEDKKWTLTVVRGENKDEQILTASYVIMAVGAGGQTPLMPKYPDQDKFRGSILHSHYYKSPDAWKGLRGVVIGTANTAHDVAEDMVLAGLKSVTMVQRRPTYILPGDHFRAFSQTSYNENIPTDVADRAGLSMPNCVFRLVCNTVLGGMASAEPEQFQALEKAGFKTVVYGDVAYHIYERMGGHYMDVGNCKRIVDGTVKVKSDALPQRYTPDGIDFTDGTHLPADVVIFATGFRGTLRSTVITDIFGKEIASQVKEFWGIDAEGEINGAYRPTGHPGFFYTGGPLGHSRYLSRHIALQINAEMLGTPLPLYEETP